MVRSNLEIMKKLEASFNSSFVCKYWPIEGLTKNNPFGCKVFGTLIGSRAPEAFPNEIIIPLVFKQLTDFSNVDFPTPS